MLPESPSVKTRFVRRQGRELQLIGVLALGLLALAGCTIVSRGPALVNAPFSVRGVTVPPEALNGYLESSKGFSSAGGQMRCAYTPLGQTGMRLFVWALCLERGATAVGPSGPVEGSGFSAPAAFTVRIDGSRAHIVGVELPDDGGDYAESLRRIFPASIQETVNLDAKQNDARLTALQEHLIANAYQ